MVCSETPVQQWLHPLMSLLLIHAVETITAAVQRLNWTPVLSSCIKDQFRVDSHNSSFIWTLNRRAVGGFVCGGHLSISVERHHLGILKNKEGAFVNRRMFRCVCARGKLGQQTNLRVSRVCERPINDTSHSRSDVWQDLNAKMCSITPLYTQSKAFYLLHLHLFIFKRSSMSQ